MKLKQDNRGISLVEIIIVVAIMTIVGGGLYIGISAVSDKPSQQCAEKLVHSLTRHRTTAMGKKSGGTQFEIKKNTEADGGRIVAREIVEGVPSEWIPISDRTVDVYYTIGGTETKLDSTPLVLKFKRGSGGFEKVAAVGDYCTQLRVIRGDSVNTEFIVELSPLTGKVNIKR